MEKLISNNQFGFMRSRQASESILIVNEVCNSLKTRKAHGFILKIDFEKAFHFVNWDFLFEVLERKGLGSKFISWIKFYYSSARYSVLVNGSPSKEFSPSCGLRQGDSLSPPFFNLVVEVLSFMIYNSVQMKKLRGIRMSTDGCEVTHVQFADDTIIFLNDDIDSIKKIKRVLVCFQLLLGLRINFFKSIIYSQGLGVNLLTRGSKILGCE